jgi:hypothetical protein
MLRPPDHLESPVAPVVRVITYSLMDAYRIIVVREQNHFVQARRVMELARFPGRVRPH